MTSETLRNSEFKTYIARVVAEAPPLSAAQEDVLAGLLGKRTGRVLATAPATTFVEKPTVIYRHYDKCGCLLYIGVSNEAIKRTYAHSAHSWWSKWTVKVDIEEVVFTDRNAALEAERVAITSEGPIFNSVHATDRRGSVLRYLIEHDEWPHLQLPAVVDPDEKPELLRTLLKIGMLDGVMWVKQP